VRMGQYHDAIGAYETVMQGSADALTGFNLVLCYYALEDTAQMKKAFVRLVAIPIQVCVLTSCMRRTCAAQSCSIVQFE
jgi:intraflagellar transport protein 88